MDMFNLDKKLQQAKGNEKAQHEAGEMINAHFGGLHDQNEDEAGNLVDFKTGEKINNESAPDDFLPINSKIFKVNKNRTDALKPIKEKTAEELVAEYEASLNKR